MASGTSVTLANITSAKPTGFIHQDIKKFYDIFDNSGYASKDKKKENTADVVLLYNCSIAEVQTALKDRKVSGLEDSLCEITGTGKKFAMVSLKAGGDSYRTGRAKGVFDTLGNKLSFSGTPVEKEKYVPTQEDLQRLEEELRRVNEQKFGNLTEETSDPINEDQVRRLSYSRRDA